MTELEKKWIDEGYEAIQKLKNAIDTFKELKRKATLKQNYEEASKARDMEVKFVKEITQLFEIKIK